MTREKQAPAPPPGLWWRSTLALARKAPGLSALVAMAVVAVAIAGYLTTVHYAKIPLVCSASGPVNCAAVTSSRYSVVPGTSLPITIPGMLWFLVSGVLAGMGLRRSWDDRPEPAWLRLVHFAWAAVGLIFVLYLIYCEIVLLHQICEWCTAVHVLTFATFLVALARLQQQMPESSRPPVASARARGGLAGGMGQSSRRRDRGDTRGKVAPTRRR